jgi:uncharacterized protein (UPF0261 family)
MPIVIMGMLDEREGVLRIIKEQIERRGHKTLLMDITIGTGGIVPTLKPDITADELLATVGTTAPEVKSLLVTERDRAISLMAKAMGMKLMELYRAGQMEGVIAIAGMTGTFLSLTAMNRVPFGVPKVLISSVVAMPAYATWLAEYFGLRDITVMNTVVDTVGMNLPVKTVAVNGANAISGMVEGATRFLDQWKTSLVMTEFAFCDEGAQYVRELLEGTYDVVSFHAQGIGDRAAVDLVAQGFFQGFIDLVPASFGEYLLGGNRASGPDRLDVSKDLPIPYILTPCGFDMISCGPIDRRMRNDHLWESRKLAQRKLFMQDAVRVQARTSPEEMALMAAAVAEKLNQHRYKTLVRFVIPKRGFSSLSAPGGALYDPESDAAFTASLKEHLDPEIRVYEVDAEVNSREFAQRIATVVTRAMEKRPRRVWDRRLVRGWPAKP